MNRYYIIRNGVGEELFVWINGGNIRYFNSGRNAWSFSICKSLKEAVEQWGCSIVLEIQDKQELELLMELER